jgi:hypothetical protein
VAEKLQIELPWRADCDELAEALRSRGLSAEIVEEGEQCRLDVGYATDEVDRLYGDVSTVVESWTNERGKPLILTRLNGRCALRPPAD